MKLDGKVSIVTGGGRGIRRVISLRLASEGASVVVSGTTKENLDAVAREIRDKGGRAIAAVADVADEAAVERLVAATLDEFGRIDILINNAGTAGPTALSTEATRE